MATNRNGPDEPPAAEAKWVEVNLDHLGHNVREVRRFLRPGVRLMAVVKADGYGHGAVPAAAVALKNGAESLGVSTVREGIELRRAGIAGPILVMGAFLPGETRRMIRHNLTATVTSLPSATGLQEEAARQGVMAKAHIKVDTGMGRYGLLPGEAAAAVRAISKMPNLEMEGIFTHFAAAFTRDREFTRRQFASFTAVVRDLAAEGIDFPLRHAASSAAVMRFPETHLDLVRVGALLYGQGPEPEIHEQLSLQPTWALRARLTSVRAVPAGTNIGYGKDFAARKGTTIGVLPIGYADGYLVQPVNRPGNLRELCRAFALEAARFLQLRRGQETVVILGKRAPILGRVGMQHCVVDVGEIHDAVVGSTATLDGRRSTVSSRIPRWYREEGRLTRHPGPGRHPVRRRSGLRQQASEVREGDSASAGAGESGPENAGPAE